MTPLLATCDANEKTARHGRPSRNEFLERDRQRGPPRGGYGGGGGGGYGGGYDQGGYGGGYGQ